MSARDESDLGQKLDPDSDIETKNTQIAEAPAELPAAIESAAAESGATEPAESGVTASAVPGVTASAESMVLAEPPCAQSEPGCRTEPPPMPEIVAAKSPSAKVTFVDFTRSLRFRLTLMYSLTLFGVAAIVVGGIYWGLAQSLRSQQISLELGVQPGRPAFDVEQDIFETNRQLEYLFDQRTLSNLQRYSTVGLGVLFLASFGAGWFTAGRVLEPIGRITRVARDIQATDLSRRIGLLGPDDELKGLADTFDDMLNRLERAFDNQQRLIYDTSHELRNPLAVMRTNLDVTLSDPDASNEELRQTSEVVNRSAQRMSNIVDDLLAYARHEAANHVEGTIKLDVILYELVEEFSSSIEANHVEIQTDIDAELLLLGHRRSIEQAISNLLDNALRFSPQDSVISVAAGKSPGWVWVTVSDQGPGIAEEHRDKIFDRYVTIATDRKDGGDTQTKGSGLGLAIVREIVHSHCGEVCLLDTPVGATFAIWLPSSGFSN